MSNSYGALPLLNEKYQLNKQIGEGGFGEVYVATDISLQRKVAVKLLKKEISEQPSAAQRFLNEARLTSQLTHPNTLTIYDFGKADDRLFLVSELLQGEPLSTRLQRCGPMAPSILIPLLIPVCNALAEAHNAGVIHRDLKPDNLYIHNSIEGEKLILIDFGIAKSMGDIHLTQTGQIFGTPYYMAPEQIKESKDVDNRTDIYSLGIILYEALSGMLPFSGDSLFDIFDQHMRSATPLLAEQVSAELTPFDFIIGQMVSKDINKRPSSILEISQQLKAYEHFIVESPIYNQQPSPFFDQTIDIIDSTHNKQKLIATRMTIDEVSLTTAEKNTHINTQQATDTYQADIKEPHKANTQQSISAIKLTPNTISNETSSSSSHPILPPKNKLFFLFILLLGISLSLLGVLLLQSNPQQDKHIVKADQRGPTQDASNTTGSRAELKDRSLAKIKNSKEPSTTEQGIKTPVDQNPPPLKISKPTQKKPRKKAKKHVNIGSIAVKLFPIKPTYKPNETVSIMSKVKSGKISNRWLSVRVGKKVGRYVRGESIMVSQDWIKIGTIKWTNETNHTKIKVCYAKICGVLKTSVKDLMNIEF